MYVVNYDFQPVRKPTTCDAKLTTQLAALPAQLLAWQQARNPASNPARKHAPYAAGLTIIGFALGASYGPDVFQVRIRVRVRAF